MLQVWELHSEKHPLEAEPTGDGGARDSPRLREGGRQRAGEEAEHSGGFSRSVALPDPRRGPALVLSREQRARMF